MQISLSLRSWACNIVRESIPNQIIIGSNYKIIIVAIFSVTQTIIFTVAMIFAVSYSRGDDPGIHRLYLILWLLAFNIYHSEFISLSWTNQSRSHRSRSAGSQIR